MIGRNELHRMTVEIANSSLGANEIFEMLGVDPEEAVAFLADLGRGILDGAIAAHDDRLLLVVKTAVAAFQLGVMAGREAATHEGVEFGPIG